MEDHVARETTKALQRVFEGPMGEVGNLISDRIRFARWKSAIRILEKANTIVAREGRHLSIPELKFLVPFFEACSLEGENNKGLDEMWANLLISSTGGELSGHLLFCRILKEITKKEAQFLLHLVSKPRGKEKYAFVDAEIDRRILLDSPSSPLYQFKEGWSEDDYLDNFINKFELSGVRVINITLAEGVPGVYPYQELADCYDSQFYNEYEVAIHVCKSLGLIDRIDREIVCKKNDWIIYVDYVVLTELGARFLMAVAGKSAQSGYWNDGSEICND